MRKIRLAPGDYRAESEVVVSKFRGAQHLDYTVYPPGSAFTIPEHVPPFASFATYHPDFGDPPPRYVRNSAPTTARK